MSNCYWCNVSLTKENHSEEHIIKQSLGGKLQSPNLLCVKCNSDFGHKLDSKFSEELDYIPIGLNLPIKNVKKKHVGMYKENGEKVRLAPGLKLTSYITYSEGDEVKKIPNIKVEDLETQAFKKIQELKKRGKGDYKAIEVKLPKVRSTYYFHKDGEAEFGSINFHMGFLKMAINFSILNKIETKYLEYPIEVLKGNIIDKKITRFCYLNSFAAPVLDDEVSHFLFVRGDSKNRLLYSYIELFSTHKMLVFLNCDYGGKDVESQYCFDLLKNKVVDKKISGYLTRNHYEDYQKFCFANEERVHRNLYCRLEKIIEKRSRD